MAQEHGGTAFRARLELAIAESGKTKGRVASDLGADPSRISEWLSGKGTPSLDYMVRLPGVLGVSGHWLLTGKGERRPADPEAESAALAEIAAIIDRVRATSADEGGEEDAILATPEDGEGEATKIEGE